MNLTILLRRLLENFWPNKRVFVSYAHEHEAQVKTYVEVLQAVQSRVFYDRHITPGTDWQERIDREVQRAGTLLIFWCRHASGSEFVAREIDAARARRARIVPMIIDDTELPTGVGNIQGSDLRNLGWEISGDMQAVNPSHTAVQRINTLLNSNAAADTTTARRNLLVLTVTLIACYLLYEPILGTRYNYERPLIISSETDGNEDIKDPLKLLSHNPRRICTIPASLLVYPSGKIDLLLKVKANKVHFLAVLIEQDGKLLYLDKIDPPTMEIDMTSTLSSAGLDAQFFRENDKKVNIRVFGEID